METPREDTTNTYSGRNHPDNAPLNAPNPRGANSHTDGGPTNTRNDGATLVREDLARFGPHASCPKMSLDEAFGYCESVARRHYENFSVTNGWIPRSIRPHFCSIYAYCRWSDDLADESESTHHALDLLTWWQSELDRCFQGHARHPVFIALRHTIAVFDLPKSPFDDLLSAFVQDQSVLNYETEDQLRDYCRRSADPVGRLVLGLARVNSEDAFRYSDSICSGLQIANFCQDIVTDARRGRIYWPKELLNAHGIQPSDWLHGPYDEAWGRALCAWASSASQLLRAGAPLVSFGPRWFARSVQLFARGGLTLLDNLRKHDFDVWNHNITVDRGQKLRLILDACIRARSQKWGDLTNSLHSQGSLEPADPSRDKDRCSA
ncbi:MAG: squalene synthase HpnC [Planctomycetota bacterium]